MISNEDIKTATGIARPLFSSLQDLYELLPETWCDCQKPGQCCTYLPEMTSLEALQWVEVLRSMPEPDRRAKLERFLEFYFTTPFRPSTCPFLEDGGCGIYAFRTFGCRAYGLWSQEMGRSRTAENREARKTLSLMWKKFGVDIPADSIQSEMDYCDKVRIFSQKPFEDSDLMQVLQRIYELSGSLGGFQRRFEEQLQSDFSFLLASLALGTRKALLEKFAIVKELVQKGTDSRLRKLLPKASPEMLDV